MMELDHGLIQVASLVIRVPPPIIHSKGVGSDVQDLIEIRHRSVEVALFKFRPSPSEVAVCGLWIEFNGRRVIFNGAEQIAFEKVDPGTTLIGISRTINRDSLGI